MKTAEICRMPERGAEVWPLSVEAELVIEVCVTSHEYDRSKLRAYAGAGVKECWLVLEPEKRIEVHRQPAGEQFAERAVQGPGGSLTGTAVPGFTVDLNSLFAA